LPGEFFLPKTDSSMPLHFKDSIRLIQKLSWAKIWNAGKIYSSYYLSRWTGKVVQWGLPFTVSIEPTTACNLRCPECPSGLRAFSRPTGNLRADFFRRSIDELEQHLLFLIFYFQGEPYINPDFLDMVAYAEQRGIYTITSSNGHFLDEENARKTVESGLSRLIISIDGSTQEVYEQYRVAGHLEKVLQGARNVVKWKKELRSSTPHLVFQCLVVKPNEHQIPEIYQLAQEIGVDEVKLKSAQVYDFEHGNPLIPDNERYSRYKKMPDGTFRIKNRLLNHCWKLWHACVITWDGKVVPCCFDKDAKYRLGDLRQNSLSEVWQSEAYHQFRQKLLLGRREIDICTNCTEGCETWLAPDVN
jgi:radical SAM protein with 4Fe4S-binding SPASM domain